jgi:hypothetical protein
MKIREFELDDFTVAYLICALWSSVVEGDSGENLDQNYDLEDIHDETLKEMISDCNRFRDDNENLLEKLPEDYENSKMGHNFWLTRNGHGSGWWDEGLGKLGEDLTSVSHSYGEYSLYVGDDGLIYGTKG